jgi:hypothetical protein
MLKLDCKRLAVVFGLIIFLMYYIGRQVFHPYSYAAFIAFGFCLADAVVILSPWCLYIYISSCEKRNKKEENNAFIVIRLSLAMSL